MHRNQLITQAGGSGLRRPDGFAGGFRGAGRQLDRVFGHLSENVELTLEFPYARVSLVLFELRRRDGGLQ